VALAFSDVAAGLAYTVAAQADQILQVANLARLTPGQGLDDSKLDGHGEQPDRRQPHPGADRPPCPGLGVQSGRDHAADRNLCFRQHVRTKSMGTQGQKRTDAHGAIKRAAAQAKATEKVPHVGSPKHIPSDPGNYKQMSPSKACK
jgi:hypothetical protein